MMFCLFQNGTFLGAISFAAILCFGGFLIFFPHIPFLLYWIRYVSYLAFSFESLVQAIYGFGRTSIPCPQEATYCHYKVPGALLKELGMTEMHFWRNISCLSANFVILVLVTYCTLKRKLSKS